MKKNNNYFQAFIKKIINYLKNPYFVLIVLSGILTIIWFKKHTFQLSGEEIFEIYNPIRTLHLDSNPWLYLTGSNLPSDSLYLARLPFLLITSLFFIIGFSGWTIQALSYFLLIICGTLGIAYFAQEISNKNKTFWLPFTAGAFYLLNPFSMSQVWGRFIYNGMFAWALLPIAVLTIYKWLITGKRIWIGLLLFFSFFLSHAYANPGFIVAIWLPLFILMGSILYRHKDYSISHRTIILRISIILFFETLLNLWWIYPYGVMSKSVFSEVSNWSANLNSLIGVSRYFPTAQVVLLKQTFLFSISPLYKFWFNQPWIVIIEWIVFVITLMGIAALFKNKNWLYIFLVFVVSWFFIKGSNNPFGNLFYYFLFKTFTFMGAIRNPYEKLGIDWIFPYSVFFAFGFTWLLEKYKWFRGELIVFLMVFVLGFSVIPMWTGAVFGEGIVDTNIHIPYYYEQANKYLNRIGDRNLLDMPFLAGDGIKYTWGFQGFEPSEFLFDRTSISKILRVKYYDNIYLSLQKFLDNKNFPKILGLLGIENIVVHKDEVIPSGSSNSLKQTVALIKNWDRVMLDKPIGKLIIYDVDKKLLVPIIYSPTKVVRVKSLDGGLKEIIDGRINPLNTIFVTKKSSDLIKDDWEEGKILYNRLSPTKYQVKVYGIKKHYILVLNDMYNSNWLASVGGKIINTHFVANNFSNGWIISRKGTYIISIQLKIWPWE